MNAASTSSGTHDASRAWLVCSGRVLASAEIAVTRSQKRTGLIGRKDLDGALVLPDCNWIHTIGVKFPIDVAYLDTEGTVLKTASMGRLRVGAPVSHACTVIEARAGAFDRWGLHPGDVIEVRAADEPAS